MKPGSVLYIKAAKTEMKRRTYGQFTGHGVCLLLGDIPDHASGVTEDAVLKTMLALGFIRIDELETELGPEKFKELQDKMLAKHFPKPNLEIIEGAP